MLITQDAFNALVGTHWTFSMKTKKAYQSITILTNAYILLQYCFENTLPFVLSYANSSLFIRLR